MTFVYKVHGASYSDQFIGGYSIKYQALESLYLFAVHQPLTETPKEYLRRLSPRLFSLLDCVARYESKWQNIPNYLYDGEDGRYTAFGPFQILKSTAARYSDEDRRDPYANIRIAVKIFQSEGLTPWLVRDQCK